jgi:hypothetical protein
MYVMFSYVFVFAWYMGANNCFCETSRGVMKIFAETFSKIFILDPAVSLRPLNLNLNVR